MRFKPSATAGLDEALTGLQRQPLSSPTQAARGEVGWIISKHDFNSIDPSSSWTHRPGRLPVESERCKSSLQ